MYNLEEMNETVWNKFVEIVQLSSNLLGRYVVFEHNDTRTQGRVEGMCYTWLAAVTADPRYEVVCNEINNPPELVDACRLRIDLIENRYINLGRVYKERYSVGNIILRSTGAEFTE